MDIDSDMAVSIHLGGSFSGSLNIWEISKIRGPNIDPKIVRLFL